MKLFWYFIFICYKCSKIYFCVANLVVVIYALKRKVSFIKICRDRMFSLLSDPGRRPHLAGQTTICNAAIPFVLLALSWLLLATDASVDHLPPLSCPDICRGLLAHTPKPSSASPLPYLPWSPGARRVGPGLHWPTHQPWGSSAGARPHLHPGGEHRPGGAGPGAPWSGDSYKNTSKTKPNHMRQWGKTRQPKWLIKAYLTLQLNMWQKF